MQMDVFRILRIVFLKSMSAGGAAGAPLIDAADYLPLSYEIFVPEQVRSARPAEKMRDTFARVVTYLRNSGNNVARIHT